MKKCLIIFFWIYQKYRLKQFICLIKYNEFISLINILIIYNSVIYKRFIKEENLVGDFVMFSKYIYPNILSLYYKYFIYKLSYK